MNEKTPLDGAASLPHPRVLLFFLSHQDGYRKPLFSRNEIFCSPDTDAREKNRHLTAIRTPPGSFDINDVLRQLPNEQHPELIIVKADATRRSLPRNLAAVHVPKVLIVGDTHHLYQPIRGMVRYAQEEPFDFVIFDHTRHHARFFAEAGCRNLFWLPALDYGYLPRPLSAKPSRPLTFVGQAGRHHPYRCAVLDRVRAAGLPLQVLQAPLAQTADIYADSQITLNVSLNGDLNLRIFESLSAGGFLLTDELATDSGLSRLFTAGQHLDTWRTPDELVEKIRHYLAHPEEVQRMRREGQEEIQRHHTPAVKLREFYDLVHSGRVNPRYDFQDEPWPRNRTIVNAAPVFDEVAAHEAIQEIHRGASQVVLVDLDPGKRAVFAGLPRVRFTSAPEVAGATDAGSIHRVLCWNDTIENRTVAGFAGTYHLAQSNAPAVLDRMAAWGLAPVASGSPLYQLMHPGLWLEMAWNTGNRELVAHRLAAALAASRTADDCLVVAHLAEELGENALRQSAVEMAVSLDRANVPALFSNAALLLDHGQNEAAIVMLEEAARLQPLPADAEALRVRLVTEFKESEKLAPYFRVTGRQSVEAAETPLTILLVTNLLPPQELGGYGRSLWEFAHGLKARGHRLRILTANAPEFEKPATRDEKEMETCVNRSLELLGTWKRGKVEFLEDRSEIMRRVRDNAARVRTAVTKQRPNLVLAGNVDLLGISVLRPALEAEVPVLHVLGNASPGYTVADQPTVPHYRPSVGSNWAASAFREAGYTAPNLEIVHPGARIDRFFRFFLPDTKRLRICFASLVMPFKGAHTLIAALIQLHRAGIDFTAEIGGDAPDPTFLAQMQELVREHGIEAKVRFTGFLDRDGLVALFARSNVLVFPSMVPETFGISQVEALASGLVVVTSGTGGAREVIRDGVDGLLFAAGDVADLSRKLTSLAQDPELFARLQRNSQPRAVEFSVDTSVRKIETIAAEMCAAVQMAHAEIVPLESWN